MSRNPAVLAISRKYPELVFMKPEVMDDLYDWFFSHDAAQKKLYEASLCIVFNADVGTALTEAAFLIGRGNFHQNCDREEFPGEQCFGSDVLFFGEIMKLFLEYVPGIHRKQEDTCQAALH